MKKRLLAMLLSALMVANISACSYAPENEIDGTFENIDTTESNFEETDEKATESEENADIKPPRKSPDFFNGVWDNSNATYTFNQNGEFSVYIADWDENHLFTSFADVDIAAAKYCTAAISVNNKRAFLILEQFYKSKITVVSFERGSQNETVVEFDVDETTYEEGYVFSGNFINENTGYIFVFKEVPEGARGSSKLSNFFKTKDGGKTWDSINIQHVPSISLRNHIRFAKMISEDVGLVSGGIGPADYDFCERTLLTTDGGLNWVHVNIPELPQEDDLHWAEVADFSLVDENYVLTIRYETLETEYSYAKYKLIDQNTWIRIN